MANFTVYEQLLLELMNRARLDPLAEAARLNIDLNAGLAAGTITSATKQALAPNNNLVTAARAHSQYMIDTDQFDHAGIGDGTPSSRIEAAGYTAWSTAGENIAYSGDTGPADVLAETYNIADNLFLSEHHRTNTLANEFREAGTGTITGVFTETIPGYGTMDFNVAMITENFGTSGSSSFVSGVTINDLDGDNFYDVGEARANVSVAVTTSGFATVNDVSEAAGGYSAAVNAGQHDVTFSGGGLTAPVTVTITSQNGGSDNAKVDLSGTNKILSSVTTTLGAGAKDLVLLGAVIANGTGNGLDNFITGSRGTNSLAGLDGNDTLVMSAQAMTGSNDVFDGGNGTDTGDFSKFGSAVWLDLTTSGSNARTTDTVNAGSGAMRQIASFTSVENITGSAFSDVLTGGLGDNVIVGGNGNDNMFGGYGGADVLDGGAGDDSLRVYSGADVFIGGSNGVAGDTVVFTAWANAVSVNLAVTTAQAITNGSVTMSGIENITGGSGNDVLTGDANANFLNGAAGDDTLVASGGADSLSGGVNTDAGDTASFAGLSGGVTINLDLSSAQVVSGGSVKLSSIENIIGTSGNDFLRGTALANRLDGGAGDDTFNATFGTDTYIGGSNGASGDTLSLSTWTTATNINLGIATAQTVAGATLLLSGIENIIGGSGDDQFTGTASTNILRGGAGADRLVMSAQSSTGTIDIFDGSAGTDTADFSQFGSAVWLDITTAASSARTNDTATTAGGTLRQIANFSGIENISGSAFSDILTGDGASNTITGGNGNDNMFGGYSGNDILSAGAGDDYLRVGTGNDVYDGGGNGAAGDTLIFTAWTSAETVSLALSTAQTITGGTVTLTGVENIQGGSGNDRFTGDAAANVLTGGTGHDTLTGGDGADRFDFNALVESGTTADTRDIITDFTSGVDRIDFATIDANGSLVGDAFTYLAAADAAFTGTPGQVRWYQSGGNTFVEVNTGNDTTADLSIQLNGLNDIVDRRFRTLNFDLASSTHVQASWHLDANSKRNRSRIFELRSAKRRNIWINLAEQCLHLLC